jgi:RHS repeat-associated protein
MGVAPNGPGYTGHVNDPDTGLVYMQARYYDPVTARFLAVDPVNSPAGDTFKFNRYVYANNNPVSNIDPDGRDILVITGGRRSGSTNVFGHVAASVQGYGMASYGTATSLGSSTTQYITEQSAFRTQTVSVISTTPSQDAQAVNFIKTNQSQNTATIIDNCSVKTNLIINASSIRSATAASATTAV